MRVATAILPSQHPLVGLHNQFGSGCDSIQGRHFNSRPEPSPTLSPRRSSGETRRIPEFARTGQDEHLDPTLKGSDFREDPIPVPAPPGDPVTAHVFLNPITS